MGAGWGAGLNLHIKWIFTPGMHERPAARMADPGRPLIQDYNVRLWGEPRGCLTPVATPLVGGGGPLAQKILSVLNL